MTTWDPSRYLAFERERTRPAMDLLAAVPTHTATAVVDLGCGPGNSTELLSHRYPDAAVVGIDNSADMLARARERLPGASFHEDDIATWAPSGLRDVIFANAALQWVPDHATLMPRLAGYLAPGGSLAVQMPDTWDAPAHRAMRDVATLPRWAGRFAAAEARAPIGDPSFYWRLLRPHAATVEVWSTVYHHVVAGPRGVVDWLGGTALRPFLAPLSEPERDDFRALLEERVGSLFTIAEDGSLLLPYPRLFVVATR